MNIYVGNLAWEVGDSDLRSAFEAFGQVDSAKVTDKFSGKSKGFGFVEMPNAAEGQAGIEGVNGKDLKGRPVRVNEARPRPPREGGSGPRGGGSGGFRGGRGHDSY